LWFFVALEGVVALALLSSAVFGVRTLQAGLSSARAASTMRSSSEIPFERAPLEPGLIDVASDTVGTFMGMRDELLIERMHGAQVVRAKLNKGGSSISFRLDFADGSRAAFKPSQINPQTVPRKEVAAYRLSRLLGFNSVAPATMRTLHRDDLVGKLPPDATFLANRIDAETTFDPEGFTRGELSFWIPEIVDSHLDAVDSVLQWWRWMTIGEEIPADKVAAMAQLSSLLVFDMLQNNSDRFSGGNLQMSPDRTRLYWMDNAFGFQVDPEGHSKCQMYLFRTQKFSRRMVAALRRLDFNSLRDALEIEPQILSTPEMTSILDRRDVTLKYIDGLIAQFGDERVLVFP
jgi:hypothetical protein